jgi:hypothetical protein
VNRWIPIVALAFIAAGRLSADTFSQGLSPADFAAAGLSKLTPDELARLDALVAGKQAGAVETARKETTTQVTATVREQVKAEYQEAARKTQGIIERMSVVLKPGTEIQYTTLDSTIDPPFDGWFKGKVIELSNGQRWACTDSDEYYGTRTTKPVHVRIEPGSMGSFFMEVEGFGRLRVKYIGSSPSQTPAH